MSYVKVHAAWSTGDVATGEALNHIETQYDEMKAVIDAHSHDATFYTKASSDAKFFSATFRTGFDADLLDGEHITGIAAAILPVGSIIIWGSLDPVPDHWHLCDGGGGTIDMRDKFPLGAKDGWAYNSTGGAYSTVLTGSIEVADHVLIASELPVHTHDYEDDLNNPPTWSWSGWTCYAANGGITYREVTTGAAGNGGGHGHEGSTISINNLVCTPPYVAVYFIQKVS